MAYVKRRDMLRRIDRHLEENSAVIKENSALIKEIREEVRLHREAAADVRVFIRDITRRNEAVLREVIAEMRDLRAESRAQREALLRLIDRLPPPANGPAAA